MPFGWNEDTSPFLDGDGAPPARFALRQVDDDTFELLEPFTFDWKLKGEVLEVRSDLIGHTDLASIPSFLGWFARRHGRHTPAALLHDQLITTDGSYLPANQQMPATAADLLFREALLACDVPVVKSWVLWTGVTLRTRFSLRPWGLAGIVVWFIAALVGTAALIYGSVTNLPLLVVLALLAPIPFALLWGQQFRAGLVAGYAFWLVILGSLPAWLAYQAYRAIEYIARSVLRSRFRDAPVQPPPAFSKR
jgi:Protein of unknown function (DUF1353)